MTDAELIELAAKAAAINAVKDQNNVWRDCTGMPPSSNIFDAKPWNPLTDDRDALHLAIKLNMKINISYGCVEVRFTEDMPGSYIRAGIDKYEATRLAIVRAAAEIGRVPMTEEQFDAAMRTFKLEREYADYIMERYEKEIEQGMGLMKLKNSGDFLQGFKEKMTGIKNDQN